ncbi:MAG TPA: CPBP family intramembrane metalloprotease [Deltaproteobacteria bacterium]|jgi:membrane protease YdiL (CAAX protease family)|nr:CPBP family intramembrane metalloprotease [Deltaproteobacteria bacterium]HQJ08308.1 CPBP family intramembrane metalloprotease [Deltaproteobacteria bacterium]
MGLKLGYFSKRALLCAECAVLFFILPVTLYFIRHWFAWRITPIVLLVSFLCFLSLITDKDFDRKRLWHIRDFPVHIKAIMITFFIAATGIAFFTYLFQRMYFLYFLSAEPRLWLVFVLIYPLLVVYPQELVFRAFFFHRYRSIFEHRLTMIALSGISFGLAHLFFANWYAPVLSTLGGILFAYRYTKAQSLVVAAFEHGLWGNFLFTIGMGWYFYSGSIR